VILPQIEHIENLFKTNTKFTDKEGKLFIPKILEAIDKIESDLIKLLMGDAKAKEQFFIKIDDVYVLNQNDLIEFFTMNEYFNHSFTSYTNKIGLIKKDSFVKKFDDVVLAFPYKDCVLEGGQTKDDEKNSEVFYNSIISRDEIDRLLEPKVLTNIKRFDKDGEHEVEEIKEDDNLIIKGNNLLALHSLKKRYAGKVKLIYIDPPYNTGSDSFGYNDSFNHSTWLTFMKNRLEVAREFLSEDGSIFISCDDNEQHYLRILLDEIFGRKNFISEIIIQSNKGGRDYLPIAITHEYLICYAKDFDKCDIKELIKSTENYKYEDSQSRFETRELRNRNPKFTKENRPNLYYPVYINESSKDENGFCLVSLNSSNSYTTVTYPKNSKGCDSCWRWGKDKFLKNNTDNLDSTQLLSKQKRDGGWNIYEKNRKSTQKVKSIWDETDMRTEKGTIELREIFNEAVFPHPKPLALIKRCIQITTNSNDTIMDFHAGSGTTAHAVLDLNKEDGFNRKFILVEQMDYIEDITVERVKKVLEKNNQGDFVYAELKEIDNFSNSPIGQLNKNMQYLPISEIEDEEYAINEKEIAINKQFYGVEDE